MFNKKTYIQEMAMRMCVAESGMTIESCINYAENMAEALEKRGYGWDSLLPIMYEAPNIPLPIRTTGIEECTMFTAQNKPSKRYEPEQMPEWVSNHMPTIPGQ